MIEGTLIQLQAGNLHRKFLSLQIQYHTVQNMKINFVKHKWEGNNRLNIGWENKKNSLRINKKFPDLDHTELKKLSADQKPSTSLNKPASGTTTIILAQALTR